ncbi:amidohydrolase [Ancrocorticia populi]|uniref:Amidohydrolase n=1 Tax=Ancrocorticia populi TaxID=2175228 RepID=A0A2V1K3X2_9ACTO|nr:amidohydrolase [Ancrocorticia populi]PWF25943.1 amidohydrolase [Ancrocorticia populi]
MSTMIDDRRTLHLRPETGFCEIETAAYIYERLESLMDPSAGDSITTGDDVIDTAAIPGLTQAQLDAAAARALEHGTPKELVEKFSNGRTGIVAEIKGNRPGPVMGLRTDIDGLGVTESDSESHVPTAKGFVSELVGVMHACGHDGHISVALELVKRLTENRDFPGSFRIIFQPAEEGVRGAMVTKASATDGVDIMLGMHLGLSLKVGEVGAGTHGQLATEKTQIDFTGAQAHAAMAPEQGRNALLAACSTALTLHSLPQRADANTRLNVGVLNAGSGLNIIANHATMNVEYRSDTREVLADLKKRVAAVVAGNAQAYGVESEITPLGQATTLLCDQPVIDKCVKAAEGVAGLEKCEDTVLFAASDDVSIFIERVQDNGGEGTFLVVGCSSPGPHHSATFDIDERALPIAADWIENIARS